MHGMPRLAAMVWISTGVKIWGEVFLEEILDKLYATDTLFAAVAASEEAGSRFGRLSCAGVADEEIGG